MLAKYVCAGGEDCTIANRRLGVPSPLAKGPVRNERTSRAEGGSASTASGQYDRGHPARRLPRGINTRQGEAAIAPRGRSGRVRDAPENGDLADIARNLRVMHFNPGAVAALELPRMEQILWEQGVHVATLVGVCWTGNRESFDRGNSNYLRIVMGANSYYKGYAGGIIILVCKQLAPYVGAKWCISERLLSVRITARELDICVTGFYSYLDRSKGGDAEYETKRVDAWKSLTKHCERIHKVKRVTHIIGTDANAQGHAPMPGFGPRLDGEVGTKPNRNTGNLVDICRGDAGGWKFFRCCCPHVKKKLHP